MISPHPASTLELPAALLHVWPRSSDTAWEGPIARLAGALGPDAGVYRLRPGLLAVVPIAGEPAILDTAVSYGRLLAAEAEEHLTGAAAGASLLVAPGTVTLLAGGAAELLPDPLLDDLAAQPAALAAEPGPPHRPGGGGPRTAARAARRRHLHRPVGTLRAAFRGR